jgi:hypothetical protein
MGGVETGGQDSSFGGEDCSAKYCALPQHIGHMYHSLFIIFAYTSVHLPFTDTIWNGQTVR